MELLSGLFHYLFWLEVPIFSILFSRSLWRCLRYSTPEIRTAVPCGLSLPLHLRGSAVGSGVQFAGAGTGCQKTMGELMTPRTPRTWMFLRGV